MQKLDGGVGLVVQNQLIQPMEKMMVMTRDLFI